MVYRDGDALLVADGFHRTYAAVAAGLEVFPAEVRDGTREDAALYAAGCNTAHGLRRTNADKRRAVERLLAHPEWSRWSNEEIARRCAVDPKTVATVRRAPSLEIPELRLVERNGTVYPMQTERIGSTPPGVKSDGFTGRGLCLSTRGQCPGLWPAPCNVEHHHGRRAMYLDKHELRVLSMHLGDVLANVEQLSQSTALSKRQATIVQHTFHSAVQLAGLLVRHPHTGRSNAPRQSWWGGW